MIEQNESILSKVRASVMVSDSYHVSPKRVVMREGGRHNFRDKLLVMQSDRASPMLRAMQSQPGMKESYSYADISKITTSDI